MSSDLPMSKNAIRSTGGFKRAVALAALAAGVDANELANADKGALGGYDRDGAVYYSFPRAAPLPLLSEL